MTALMWSRVLRSSSALGVAALARPTDVPRGLAVGDEALLRELRERHPDLMEHAHAEALDGVMWLAVCDPRWTVWQRIAAVQAFAGGEETTHLLGSSTADGDGFEIGTRLVCGRTVIAHATIPAHLRIEEET